MGKRISPDKRIGWLAAMYFSNMNLFFQMYLFFLYFFQLINIRLFIYFEFVILNGNFFENFNHDLEIRLQVD